METHGDLEEPNEVWIIFKLDDLNGFILDFYYFPSKQYDNDIQMGMHNIIVFCSLNSCGVNSLLSPNFLYNCYYDFYCNH